jgi:hypothetical protein
VTLCIPCHRLLETLASGPAAGGLGRRDCVSPGGANQLTVPYRYSNPVRQIGQPNAYLQ